MKFISTGGLGDAFIAFIRLDSSSFSPEKVEWIHVESNDLIRSSFDEYIKKEARAFASCEFVCDTDYINNYRAGKWKGYIPVSSGMDTWCPLKGETDFELQDPFRYHEERIPTEWFKERYNVAIQVSAGAKNDRKWLFEVKTLRTVLEKKGFSVILIGNDPNFYDKDDDRNFVCKKTLPETLELLLHCDNFIGLSGFLNYYCCYNKIPNMHLMESEEHDKRYYHRDWKSISLKYGSLSEILRNLGV
jgi:hypothetical protein